MYNLLENCKSFEKFYSKTEKRKKEEKVITITIHEQSVVNNLTSCNEIDQWEHLKDLDDPTGHFKKIKAKINLKAHKKYQEDIIRQEEERNKVEEEVIEIKDKLGRVMEK